MVACIPVAKDGPHYKRIIYSHLLMLVLAGGHQVVESGDDKQDVLARL